MEVRAARWPRRDAPDSCGVRPVTPSEMSHRQFCGRRFLCREWALQRLQHCLEDLGRAGSHGILITGAPGAGKTALCTEILWPSSDAGCSSRLSSRVLAYHYCQAHTHASLNSHQFIASLAQQLQESPLICGYKVDTQGENSKGDVDETFKRLVILPLMAVPPPSQNLLLLVDSVDETCCCCRSDGFPDETCCSIAELLAAHHHALPPWLLLVCSARRQNKAVTRMFTGFRRLCLDDLRKAHVVRDVQQYILCRLDREETLRQHLTLHTADMLNQLHIKSNGCFLYLERVLDGVSDGSIVLREIRHIPGTLNGLYLWLCQRLFPGRQFCLVKTLLNVLLASPHPLSPSQLHQAVWTKNMKGWNEQDFSRSLEAISGLMLPLAGPEDLKVLFHHSFSEWLLDVKYCTQKYLCNVAEGHCMLAMGLSSRATKLKPDEVHQLARHLLLSDQRGLEPSHLALWLLWTDVPVSDCLISNIALELDVLQLLLLARAASDDACNVVNSGALRKTLGKGVSVEMLLESGAGIHQRDRSGRTLLAAAAHAGNMEAVDLMISRGANLEAKDEEGQTPLGLAAHQGHLCVVQLLLQHGAKHDHTDSRGWTALRSASWGGHTDVVEALLAYGAQPDVSGLDGRTALRAAAWGGHEGPVRALLKAGAQSNLADVEGRTPLMAAAYMGHRSVAQLFLEAGADVNRCDCEGRTALAVACLCVPAGHEHPELVSLLLEHGADPELEDKDGATPLLVAAYEGQAEVAELLLEAGADPDRAGKGRVTPLLAAASGGHAETVRVLLLWGSAADVTDAEGRSALAMAAAAAGGEEAVRVLLDRGLDENYQDWLGWTPLHWAACQGRRSSSRALVEGGAKVGITDNEGYTPFLLASEEGHTGCVELLINRSSPVDQRTSDGRTALCLAALAGHRATVELLLRKGANPNIKNRLGKPLLYLLVLEGQIDMAELLLEQGADPEGSDAEDRTALHACCWQGDWEMAHLLLVKGKAQPNASDAEKRTPLHCAAWRGYANIARLLLENGAFPDAQTSQGATPLCIAAQEGHEELARVLLEEGKSCPYHTDHYGRTPIRIAGKGGHLAIVKLLERFGVPPYQGPMGMAQDKGVAGEYRTVGSGGSWSTLSPVSTGSHSQDNSLKSSKGSVLTSSTYHSQATVPMDSLTFTQQVQQHSLPRSRSRQTLALTEITHFQDQYGSTLQAAGQLNPSFFQVPDKWEEFTVYNQNPRAPHGELKRNGILTNPKCSSPNYTHGKSSESGFSPPGRKENSSSSKTQDNSCAHPKTSSSGYSSSRTGNPHHRKTGESKKGGDPGQSSHKQGNMVRSPQNVTATSPGKNGERVCSPTRIPGNGSSPRDNGRTVYPPRSLKHPEYHSKHIYRNTGEPAYSPTSVGPNNTGDPLYSPIKTLAAVYSTTETQSSLHSARKPGHALHSASKPGHALHHASKPGHAPHSASKPGHAPHSASKPGYSPRSPSNSAHIDSGAKPHSPLISITTMDPQLHLKQAIKLQFEGRTCGFNIRKETPL
ncbi:uncharacterized protein RCH25_036078 [Pelodytes ibericus]